MAEEKFDEVRGVGHRRNRGTAWERGAMLNLAPNYLRGESESAEIFSRDGVNHHKCLPFGLLRRPRRVIRGD